MNTTAKRSNRTLWILVGLAFGTVVLILAWPLISDFATFVKAAV
jgi:hypothetical protein